MSGVDESTPEPPSLYQRLGGEAGLAAYVDHFYGVMQTEPAAAAIWALHQSELDETKARLIAFLSGFVGGPVIYPARYGPAMMRARHLRFPIDEQARDLWLMCAYRAVEETFADRQAAEDFSAALRGFANHMRNRG